ncbi:MAG: 6,7-dimethyl-8-ribityllumazine synthase, partial [Phycisphaerales bacterium]
MYDKIRPEADAAGLRVGLAVSRYHHRITDALCKAAVDRFRRAGGADADLRVVRAPGAFELTAVCRAFAAGGKIDAVVALGCVISGETDHDRYLASAVATGLTMITVETGVPVAFGLLTC